MKVKFWFSPPIRSLACCSSLLLVLHAFTSVTGYKDGLYSTDDDFVVPLNDVQFEEMVMKSRPGLIWVVEFYNSWCGHCIHFAPTWKQLAKDLKDWSDVVTIAGIDCSQRKNMKTCRDFDVNAFPTIKMIPPVDARKRYQNIEPLKARKIDDIKSAILEFMTKSWPRLKPLDNIEEIWQEKQEKGAQDKQLFVIFEKKTTDLGKQVVIDLRNESKAGIFIMVKQQAAELGITEFPSLYKVNSDQTYTKMAVGKDEPKLDRLMFVERIKEEVRSSLAEAVKFQPETDLNADGTKGGQAEGKGEVGLVAHIAAPNRTQVNMQDLESALHYSFRQEVAICLAIDGDKFTALMDYVSVLKKYFPGRPPVQNFLVKVWDWLSSIKNHSVTGEEWFDQLDNMQTESQFLPDVIKWTSCQGSSPQYRGFPCGMWTLFHTLTIGAYTQNKGPRSGRPEEVLHAIRGYMEHFFGCDECAKHFLKMSNGAEGSLSSHEEAVLWLWRGHNKVNARLSGDDSEDPKFPKVQFPPKNVCQNCRVSDGGEENWDEGKVLEFLLEFYSPSKSASSRGIYTPTDLDTFQKGGGEAGGGADRGNKKELDWWEKQQRGRDLQQIQTLRERKRAAAAAKHSRHNIDAGDEASEEVRSQKPAALGQAVMSLWGLSQLDISMCVVFYVVSTVIILVLYYHFIVRRRMNPCKHIM